MIETLLTSNFFSTVLNLILPTHCISCSAVVERGHSHLCVECQSLTQLLEKEDRCAQCFCFLNGTQEWICKKCSKETPVFTGFAAALDYAGPAASLIKGLKYSGQTYLAKGMGAFMVAQFIELEWPLPDLIIPVPLSYSHHLQRGYNQSALLAKECGKLLGKPIANVLRRSNGDFSQAGLSKKQRMKLEGIRFYLKKGCQLEDKNLLLIDDVMTTGTTLKHCAQTLLQEHPKAIYALTACKAVV